MVYGSPMKAILAAIATIAILTPLAAMADAPVPLGPSKGKFGDWTAATVGTGAAKICYAFTKPELSQPDWTSRGLTMLTVTERHGSHDEISITPGYTYPNDAVVSLAVGKAKIPFYVEDNVAFTDNVDEALEGFAKQDSATATSSGPKGKKIQDRFSLTGFSAAHKAIVQACP
jgi:hypothetical protein